MNGDLFHAMTSECESLLDASRMGSMQSCVRHSTGSLFFLATIVPLQDDAPPRFAASLSTAP